MDRKEFDKKLHDIKLHIPMVKNVEDLDTDYPRIELAIGGFKELIDFAESCGCCPIETVRISKEGTISFKFCASGVGESDD